MLTVGAAAAQMVGAAGFTPAPLSPAIAQPSAPTATVVRTVDGDTVDRHRRHPWSNSCATLEN